VPQSMRISPSFRLVVIQSGLSGTSFDEDDDGLDVDVVGEDVMFLSEVPNIAL